MDKDLRILELEKENAQIRALVTQLVERDKRREREFNKLLRRVEELEKENLRLRKGKNSGNSSMPPSTDLKRKSKKRSTRKKSGRKPGGQKGRKGTNLQMQSNPDLVVNHGPKRCGQCGYNLQGLEGQIIGTGQILDIPPIHIQVTEHRQLAVRCPCCDGVSEGQLPGTLDYARVQYGPRIKSIISYLSVYQFIPVERIRDMIRVLTGQSLSSGFIQNTITATARRLAPWYDRILECIKDSAVVFADETVCRVDGLSRWLWIWCTESFNFISAASSRGYKIIESILGEGPFDFTLVSDRYAAQLKTNARDHQLCLAHLQRNCKELIEGMNSRWARKLAKVLRDINRLTGQERIAASSKKEIESRLDRLLHAPLSASHEKIRKLQGQLRKDRSHITTCLYRRDVPPDNNMAERGIRNVKVKQKVSTGFRSMNGAQAYAVIRSIVDSALKQNIHPLLAIQEPELLFNLGE